MKERCDVDAEELNSGEKVHALFPATSFILDLLDLISLRSKMTLII